MDAEASERKSSLKKKAAFEKWVDEPMVRMGISMIPAGEHKDALRMLLQSAFDAGFGAGGGDIAAQLLEGFLKRTPSDDRRP